MKVVLFVALALALSGCEQYREAQWQRAYNQKRAVALKNGWTPARLGVARPKPPPKPASGGYNGPPVLIVAAPPVMDTTPQRQQPVIIANTGAAPMTTISPDPFGGSTIVNYGALPDGVPAMTTIRPTPFGGTRIVNYGGY